MKARSAKARSTATRSAVARTSAAKGKTGAKGPAKAAPRQAGASATPAPAAPRPAKPDGPAARASARAGKAPAPAARASSRAGKAPAPTARASSRAAKPPAPAAGASARAAKPPARIAPRQGKPGAGRTPASPPPRPRALAPTQIAYPTIVAPAPLGHLLRNDARVGDATIALARLPAAVAVPSGQLAIGDPLTIDAAVAAAQVGPGPYPVVVSLARVAGEERVVAATVHLAPGPIARWEPATTADGVAIEPAITAAAAFVDAAAFRAIAGEPAAFPSASYRALERQLLTEHYVPAWGWAAYQPLATSAGNCVAVVGAAGAVPPRAWWGRDEAGALCALTLDLGAASGAAA